MKKIIVHIGQAKTGTTALQRFLSKNSKSLLKQGLVYPTPKFGHNHSALNLPFARKVQRGLVNRLGSDLVEARKVSVGYWQDAIAEAEADPHSTMLLSSEYFSGNADLKNLPSFVRNLSGFSGEVDFVYYVRRPSERFTSSLQQHIKASHKIPNIQEIKLPFLKGLRDVANLKIRHFSRNALINGDIVDDFCSVNNIYTGGLKVPSSEANTSISAEGMILLQEYRRLNHSGSNNVFTADTSEYIKAISGEEQKSPRKYTKPVLRECFAAKLDADSPVLEWLSKVYNIDLRKPNNIKPSEYRDINEVREVSQLIGFDADLVEELRVAVERARAG